MTNEEIIRHTRYLAKKHKDDTVLTFETNFHLAFTDIANHIEKQAEESAKLKEEIEQLKSELQQLEITGNKQIDVLLQDIEQLKREVGNVISPEQFEEEMKALANLYDYDIERKHGEMDDLMCKLLTELGYASGVDVFVDTDKWYA